MPWLDNIDARSLIRNLFAPFLIASGELSFLRSLSSFSGRIFLSFYASSNSALGLRFSSVVPPFRATTTVYVSHRFPSPSHFLKTQRLRVVSAPYPRSFIFIPLSLRYFAALLVNPRGTRRIA